MSNLLLDTSAVLALFNGETGSEVVAAALAGQECMISTVNVAELVSRMVDRGMEHTLALDLLTSLNLSAIGFDFAIACRSAGLRDSTRSRGLSLGDRACLATAMARDCPVLTADRAWAGLALGIEIRFIR